MSDKIPEDFEDKIEHAFWCFNDKLSKKNFSDRDCFKQTLRRYFGCKEKPMENKLQMTEEQFDNFFKDCIEKNYHAVEIFKDAKAKGYILKSAVEEAEEMYKEWKLDNCENHNQWSWDSMAKLICNLFSAIQELKAENERLKCLKP